MVRYVVLSYAVDMFVVHGEQIALVIQRPGEPSCSLELHAHPDWNSLVQDDDADYVRSVFSELQNENSSEDEESFDRLTEMSAGCLRAGDCGTCEENDLRARMPHFFDE